MDNVSRYGYINAKLRARIGLMMSSTILDSMIKAPNLNEAVAVLTGTEYDTLAEVFEKSADLQQVELELFSREIDTHKKIITALDSMAGDFVTLVLEKSEIENIRNAIRLWYSGAVLHHGISYRSAYIYKKKIVHDINWLGIINALSYDDVVSAFRGTVYHDVLKAYDEQSLASDGLFNLETDLDHLWFRRMFDGMDRLDRTDRDVAGEIYRIDVDLKNIINLIRYGFYHDVPSSRLSRVMLPYGLLYSQLKGKIEKGQLSMDDARLIITRKYPKVNDLFSKLQDRGQMGGGRTDLAYGIMGIENYLAQSRKKEFTSILSKDPFTIGTILSYIYLCKSMDNALKAVLNAKYYNWSEEQIRRELN